VKQHPTDWDQTKRDLAARTPEQIKAAGEISLTPGIGGAGLAVNKSDINALKPSDFTCHPWDSLTHHFESEIVARNIMLICKRRGDRWGKLTRDDYDTERTKDSGGLSAAELRLFDKIYPRINRVLGAITFSPTWLAAAEAAMRARRKRWRQPVWLACISKKVASYLNGKSRRKLTCWLGGVK